MHNLEPSFFEGLRFIWFIWPLLTILLIKPFEFLLPDNDFIGYGIVLVVSFLIISGIIWFIIKRKTSKRKKIIYITIALIILLPGFLAMSYMYFDCLFFGAKNELLRLNMH